MKSADAQRFDADYYQRYYFDPATRVSDPVLSRRLASFVFHYLDYLRVPVHRVLDMGCGIGLWRDEVKHFYPQAHYHGVEISPWLCERYGWEQGSVVDYAADRSYDLVICQGVLPYLSPPDLKKALANLGRLSHGAMYLEAVTREDYEQDAVDEELTDSNQFQHRASLYRDGLAPFFRSAGGGVWLSRRCPSPLFALETFDP